MLKVHHLNNSRSQRILWLLEELGLPYEIVKYQRDPATNLAPDSLKAIHPLGKSPVIDDGGQIVIESGAIIEYIVREHGKGRLVPKDGTPAAVEYLQLMHYAEGSAMLPIMLKLEARVVSEIENHMGYLEAKLGKQDWFVANEFSAADIQLSFAVQTARLLHGLAKFPNLARFLDRIHARPAYKRALEKGGTYAFGS
jgi:glutathione S-transferase